MTVNNNVKVPLGAAALPPSPPVVPLQGLGLVCPPQVNSLLNRKKKEEKKTVSYPFHFDMDPDPTPNPT